MKNIVLMAMLLVVVIGIAWGDEVAVQEDQELVFGGNRRKPAYPADIEVMGGKLSLQGFATVEATSSEGVGSEATWGNFRVNSDYAKGKLLLHTQVNFADMQGPDNDGNWLREATIGWQVNDLFVLKVGRHFLAGGMSTPGPVNPKTQIPCASTIIWYDTSTLK